MTKRIEYIDIAKGIGILLVVMGHNDFALVSPFIYKFIYSFHMPLFFFVSGMLFKPDIPFLTLVYRRFETILKPYIFTILLIFFTSISYARINFSVAFGRIIKSLYGNGFYLDWVQLWFLPHLFVLNLFAFGFYWLANRVKFPWTKWLALVVMQIIGVTFLSVFLPVDVNLLGKHLSLNGLPFSIDLLLVSGFFFILGSEVTKNIPESFFENILTLLIPLAALLAMLVYFPQKIDFNTRFFESLPVNTIEALFGITFIIALSKQLTRFPRLSTLFQYIGRASLVILIFHVPIQESWNTKVLFMVNNLALAYWAAYFAGVILPIAIYAWFIQPNPVLRPWFGQPNRKKTGTPSA